MASRRPSLTLRLRALEAENAALRAIIERVLELEAEYRSVYEAHRRAGMPVATDPTHGVLDGVERVARKVRKMLDLLPAAASPEA